MAPRDESRQGNHDGRDDHTETGEQPSLAPARRPRRASRSADESDNANEHGRRIVLGCPVGIGRGAAVVADRMTRDRSAKEGSAMGSLNATFTKWLVGEGPEMAGVVGGEVGDGAYAGKVLDMISGPTTVISAIYNFQGSERPFSALVHVEDRSPCRDHRRRDRRLGQGQPDQGQYAEIQCEHDGITTDCWRGTLAIMEGASGGRPAEAASRARSAFGPGPGPSSGPRPSRSSRPGRARGLGRARRSARARYAAATRMRLLIAVRWSMAS